VPPTNLGDNNRFLSTLFLEHRMEFSKKLDITPGVAVTYF
jgi:iron complex outermembrane receptor protein